MQDRYAFYCGAAKVREGKSLPAGGVVQLKSLGQLEEFFEPQGAGKEFCRVCRMLLKCRCERSLCGAADGGRQSGRRGAV